MKVQVSQCSDMGDSRLGDVRTINDLQTNKDAEKKLVTIHNKFFNGGHLGRGNMPRVVVKDFLSFIFLPFFTVEFLSKIINMHSSY